MIEKEESLFEKRSYQRLGLCAGIYNAPCAAAAVCKHCSRCAQHCTCKKGVTRFTPEELGIENAEPSLLPSPERQPTRR